MSMLGTYDHTKVNIQINGSALTDFNGDVGISKQGDNWETIEGQNGTVERARQVRSLYIVTLPFMQTSPQLNVLESYRIADEEANAGPYPFSIIDLNGSYVLRGLAWIASMGDVSRGRSTSTRTVTLHVKALETFEGA